ncbi:ankyrin repeat domain-containing protein [Psychrobacillus sp.]|uniref:ankyrin repeat domain-containing protein n=1 Tax=Psychrobacillus sp. TaxID=1871623 RepID=UPI0028BEB081|nr:ankyrin repeat domain-containing protein [Psychrobacillus sp.]
MFCIAGKNDIAVEIAEHALNILGKKSLKLIKNSTDTCEDSWQKSLWKFGNDNGIEVITLEDAYNIDDLIFLSLEFDKIIDPEKFNTDNLYNIHFSLLPKYKGMYTSYWPLRNGEDHSGVTLHRIDHGIDTGNIIAQKKFIIGSGMTCRELYSAYLENGIVLIKEWFHELVNSKITCSPQPSQYSSYYSKKTLNFSTLKIDLNQTAFDIKNQVRSLVFREYQLPKINNQSITHIEIKNSRSLQKHGTILKEDEWSMELSTVDYDIKCYKDNLADLIYSCEMDDINKVRQFIEFNYNLNDQNEKGWTPLIVASYHGNYNIVNLLLENGADPNLSNFKGTTPLMYAKDYCIKNKEYKLIHLLLSKGADINKKDYKNYNIFDYLKLNYTKTETEKIEEILYY